MGVCLVSAHLRFLCTVCVPWLLVSVRGSWGPVGKKPALDELPKRRLVETHMLSLGEITAVTTGQSTPVLVKRGKAKDAVLYVSVVCSHRTVDMQVRGCGGACMWLGLLSVLAPMW